MRQVLGVVCCGADALQAERRDADWAALKEAAVLGALRLLRTALERDAELVAWLRRCPDHSGTAA